MPLPQRPGPYILLLLLVVLLAVAAWMFKALNSPEIQQAVQKKQAPEVKAPSSSGSPVPAAPVPPPVFIDPVNLERANQLNAPGRTPQDDLRVVADFIELYRKAFGSNPVGQNEDITAALTGVANSGQKGRVFPPNSPAIRDGLLIDRWGSPYWFHPESGFRMEIRSAGPDKELFTQDDVMLVP